MPLLRNERDEWELPGGRIEAGETAAAAVELEVRDEHSDARWFRLDALDEIALPEPYPSAIRAGMLPG